MGMRAKDKLKKPESDKGHATSSNRDLSRGTNLI